MVVKICMAYKKTTWKHGVGLRTNAHICTKNQFYSLYGYAMRHAMGNAMWYRQVANGIAT